VTKLFEQPINNQNRFVQKLLLNPQCLKRFTSRMHSLVILSAVEGWALIICAIVRVKKKKISEMLGSFMSKKLDNFWK
jgi:hypothetical protein